MHESQDANRRLINRVLAEVGEIDEPASSSINHCGDSVVQANVRVDPIDTSLKPMSVEVHQTGADILSFEIQNFGVFAGVEFSSELQDLALFDPHIKDSINGLRGVDDVALFEQQIVDHGCEEIVSQFERGKEPPKAGTLKIVQLECVDMSPPSAGRDGASIARHYPAKRGRACALPKRPLQNRLT